MKQSIIFYLILCLIAATSMIYQFSIISSLTFILGDGVLLFSIFTGLFLFSMGLGSYQSSTKAPPLTLLINLQALTSLIGLLLIPILFLLFSYITKSQWVQYRNPLLWILGVFGDIFFGYLAGMQLPLIQRVIIPHQFHPLNSSSIDSPLTLRDSPAFRYDLSVLLSLDYLGSFLGAVLFPLFLFPTLGLLSTLVFTSMINSSLAFTLTLLRYKQNLNKISILVSIFILFFIVIQVLAFFNIEHFEVFVNRMIYD